MILYKNFYKYRVQAFINLKKKVKNMKKIEYDKNIDFYNHINLDYP